ncbi:MAG: glycosyltransferase [Bacteroidales bacterium]|jgi:glycosyltransferase involved in cell wall biosynthesis|nr:glycosyltransferase [Bacteroidales bacterium]
MNIAITIDELGMGGAQHVVYELVKNINTEKYTITIICTDGRIHSLLEEKILDEASKKKFSIVFLKDHFLKKINTPFVLFNKVINRIRQIVIDLTIIPELSKKLDYINPDLIHVHQHGMLAAYWAVPRHVPLITTIHTNPNAAFFREVERFIFKLAVYLKRITVVAISKYNYDRIKSYWHLDDSISRYINNGIAIGNFYTKPHDIFSFINTSRHDENKNQALIIRAFARLHFENTAIAMKLYLIGDGDTHETLRRLATDLEIADYVEFTGYITFPGEYLALSDVYISSSHREGLSLSVLEAMASRLPIIATDAGGVRELAQENGILIADNDEEGLYSAMKELRDNIELRREKAEKSYAIVQAFSTTQMTEEYSALYDEILHYHH